MKRFKNQIVLFLIITCFGFVFNLTITNLDHLLASSQQTSSTTAASMIEDIRSYLNDTDANDEYWTDGELLQWLNDGMVDIAVRTHCLEATDTIALTTDTIEYVIASFDNAPWYYVTIKGVHYIDSNSKAYALVKGSPISVGHNTAVTVPTYWYEWAGSIGVYPPLSDIDNTTPETIKVYYITRPTVITSTGTITTPAIYDKALMYFVVAQAKLKDRKPAEFEHIMQRYYQELSQYRMDLNEFPQQVIE